MSGPTPNRNRRRALSGDYPPPDYNQSPRHGRIPSRTIEPANSPQGQQHALPAGPASPQPTYRPIPTVMYGPMQQPTNLQRFAGESVVPFLRWAFTIYDSHDRAKANHDYYPEVDNAVWWSETIDAFDNDSRLIHELILRIADPDLGHPSMEPIRQNRSMVELLLYRHFQRHGGLNLPPTNPAVQAMQQYESTVAQARAQYATTYGVQLMPEDADWPRLKFPIWNDFYGPNAKKSPDGKGKGRGPSSGGMEGKPFWKGPGGEGSRGPPGGGAGGGGIAT
ncbi:hypothetical protein EK21DRAFT_109522 [Setomelanomma holmii]|uniref:Uncharacterized protein n=1 Tax=Setomelanomma holmii TaxID=210430 RepID=A0A9P4LQI5_9PLEO|nr:hypothetical protein EK21DRAFT_109522 [Setomelanomma holmii]